MKRSRAMPKKEYILSYWRKVLEEKGYEKDSDLLTEQTCFACPNVFETVRCHIKAVMDGGSDKPENLHLLCHSCHSESEMLDGQKYWRWFKHKRKEEFNFYEWWIKDQKRFYAIARKNTIKNPEDEFLYLKKYIKDRPPIFKSMEDHQKQIDDLENKLRKNRDYILKNLELSKIIEQNLNIGKKREEIPQLLKENNIDSKLGIKTFKALSIKAGYIIRALEATSATVEEIEKEQNE